MEYKIISKQFEEDFTPRKNTNGKMFEIKHTNIKTE